MKAEMVYQRGRDLATDPLEADVITVTGGERDSPAVVRLFAEPGHWPLAEVIYYHPVRFEKECCGRPAAGSEEAPR